MNDFESRLSEIPLRTSPSAWRAEILRNARAAAPEAAIEPWWRPWLRPHRLALAAAWVVIISLRLFVSEEEASQSPQAPLADWRARVEARKEALARLLTPPATVEPEPPAPHGAAFFRRQSRFV